MVRRKRIAFIRPKAWPLANSIVDGVIKDQFPDHEVDVIDVSAMVRQRPMIILVNSVATVFLYGKDIILRRKKFRLAFWRTPYIFREIRKLIGDKVANGGYFFSFQMQSLFDGSTSGISHFVYTDHTHLENRHYINPETYKQQILTGGLYLPASLLKKYREAILTGYFEDQPGDEFLVKLFSALRVLENWNMYEELISRYKGIKHLLSIPWDRLSQFTSNNC